MKELYVINLLGVAFRCPWGPLGKRKLSYYKGFPEQSTPVFNFCLFINERQGIRLRQNKTYHYQYYQVLLYDDQIIYQGLRLH